MVIPPIEHYRAGLEKALRYDTEGRTFEDVLERISTGHAQFWPISTESAFVTQKSQNDLHFWLATGRAAELRAMTPLILNFGREMGCTKATLTGRRGWARSWLVGDGWCEVDRADGIIQMEVEL